ncbi:hypothetical protein E2C01_084313 [Portunus trituberculatus]|uniref:Uncharacterized protein n=1 Tax=Portunus trituberculatus TaxID=210409 RepID=A0A5B7IUY7_PORTR|nr:hypothetical protein [Portunus trituberculatus]
MEAMQNSSANVRLREELVRSLILNRFKTSNPTSMAVVGVVAKATGHNIDNITLSISSIRPYRRKNRKEVATVKKIELLEWNFTLISSSGLTSLVDVNTLRGSPFTSQVETKSISWKQPEFQKVMGIIWRRLS